MCIRDRSVSTLFTSSSEVARNPVTLSGQLTDQTVTQGVYEYVVASQFSHTDSAAQLQFEASLPGGSPLPDYVAFDEATGTFQFDSEAALEAGVESIRIEVVARDSQGNGVSTSFQVSFLQQAETASEADAGQPTDNVVDSAISSAETTGAETQTSIDSERNAQQQEAVVSASGPSNPVENPVRLTGSIENQQASSGFLNFEVREAFIHTDPNEPLTLKARMANGDELPDFVSFESETGEFTVDVSKARAAGIESIEITVTATDRQGNSVESTFVVEITDDETASVTEINNEANAETNLAETDLLNSETLPPLEDMSVKAQEAPERSSLSENLKLAGQFGYQQEKITLTKALEKVFGAMG